MKKVVLELGRSVSTWACAMAGLIAMLTFATADAGIPKLPGIWLSQESGHKLTESHEEQLVQSLRRITGLPGLKFEKNGQLSLGDVSLASGGSISARQILLCTLGSGDVFIIENHCGSASVNFGQMDEGMHYEDLRSQCQLLIWRVRLDFDDFREMEASPQVRESFDVGFTTLHELLHGLGYRDAKHIEEVGDCEELINQARAELGLLLRDQYFAEQVPVMPNTFIVRLRFREPKTKSSVFSRHTRGRSHYLFFLLPPESKP